jgi:hypothetical protein
MKETWKQRIKRELILVLILSVYLFVFIVSFSNYKRVIIDNGLSNSHFYLYDLVEALILAKVIVFGRFLKLGERFLDRSLIVPVLYKTIVMSLFVVAFSIVEFFVKGYFANKEFSYLFDRFREHGIDDIVGKTPVFFSVFFLLSCLLEVGRILGGDKLFYLFFRRREI